MSTRPFLPLAAVFLLPLLGCAADAPAVGEAPASALRRLFPDQAGQVVGQAEGFGATERGFSLSARQGLAVELPRNGGDAVRFRAETGSEVRVRELGMVGEGAPAEQAVAYRRAGGTSFWAASPGGVEEWLQLGAGVARSGEVVAAWEVEGAAARQAGEAVELVDANGWVRLRVTAPVAYAAGGREVKARIAGRGSRVELSVDAAGEAVLVDPGWTAAASMTTTRQQQTATLLGNGTVMVAGGSSAMVGVVATAELYDPLLAAWAKVGAMTTARQAQTATLLGSGQVLVAGGSGSTSEMASAEIYDPISQEWSPAASMTTARVSHTATLLANGKVLVAGGGDASSSAVASAELYDPAANAWSPTGAMMDRREGHTATLLGNGKVLVAGGYGPGGYLASAELYDPVSGAWSPAGSMMTARANHTATLLANGKVLAAGGYETSAELYDPVADAWSSAEAMTIARAYHTATLLENGTVLVAGGEVALSQGFYASGLSELYDPAANTWATAGYMTSARYWHTATLLGDGSVLVAGGTLGGFPLASTELYASAAIPCALPTDCASGNCLDGFCCDAACTSPCNACSIAAGGSADGVCTPLTGPACDDGNPCTQIDTCQAGVCTGGDPIQCTTTLECHVGMCNPANAQCEVVPGQTVCAPADDCHEFGSCDPTTNTCSNPVQPDGQPCSGGTCQGGVCVPSPPDAGATGGSGGGSAGDGSPGGCGCEVSGDRGTRGGLAVVVGLLLLAGRRGRRGCRRRGGIPFPRCSGLVLLPLLVCCLSCAAADEAPASALRRLFPEQAGQVVGQAEGFGATERGFSLSAQRGLSVELPRDGGDAVRFRAETGSEVRVRELGVVGEGALAEQAVAYRRAGGTSFWSASPGGVEEWLQLGAGVARSGEVVASWEVEGATARQAGEAVELVDASGWVRLLVTAPAAYAAGGREVKARLAGRGSRVELSVDAAGEAVLVDPGWTPAPSMVTGRMEQTATLLGNGKVLVAGGNGGNAVASAVLYDPAANAWLPAASMTTPRQDHTATLLGNGKVLVAGGNGGNDAAASAELYDPFVNVWSPTGPMTTARASHTATLLGDGTVLVAGGTDAAGPMASAELYDPVTGAWSPTGTMLYARAMHTATLLGNGKVLVAGGEGTEPYQASAELYDPVAGTWSQAVWMTTPRAMHTATLLGSGKVLVAGGYDDSAELYDPVADAWSPAASMSTTRDGHTATLLGAGVLVAGGEDPIAANAINLLASAELYDPVADTWTAAGSMADARYAFTATLLGNGSVLVVGGNGIDPPLASAELYTPLAVQCTLDTDCATGSCADGFCCDMVCDDPCHACSVAAGGSADGACTPLTGPSCDDGDPCTQTDTCQSGVCTGSDPIQCPPTSEECHVGMCNPANAQCEVVPGQTVCAPADDCHEFGACDPTTNTCTSPTQPDGQPCSGGTCQGGVCVASPPDAVATGGSGGGSADDGSHGGCGCEVGGARGTGGGLAAVVGLLLLSGRRGRRGRGRRGGGRRRRGGPRGGGRPG